MKDEDESARQGGDYFCHIVIPAKDMPKSAAFYRRVFGWLVEEVPNRASLDVLPPSGKGPSAELTQVEDRIVPAIYTRDLERRLDSIARNGGRVLRGRTPIGDGAKYGYYALFEDPHGNRICLYSEI